MGVDEPKKAPDPCSFCKLDFQLLHDTRCPSQGNRKKPPVNRKRRIQDRA